MPRVLIADSLSPAAIEIFKHRGVDVDVKTGLSKDDLIQVIGDYDGLVVRSDTKPNKDVIAAAVFLDERIDEVNSLLAVEGALGRLPAVALMTAFEHVTDAAQRLRAAAQNGAEASPAPQDDPSRSLAWLRPGTNRRPVAVGERVAL